MKNKSKIFDLSAISIIACDCLQAIIAIFVDLFFVSQILNSTGATISQNIIQIGIFYSIYAGLFTVITMFLGFGLKKINKSIFVSIGALFLTVVVLLIYLLNNRLSEFVPLIAVVYAFGFSFFSAGFNCLTSETISSKYQVKFFAVKKILFQITYIIFPVSLGVIIDKVNFGFMAGAMLFVCALLIVFSFLIKPKKVYKLSYNLPEFAKYLKTHKEETKPLWLMYINSFFRGASYDCFTVLITILVMKTFESNTSLGTFQSVFTACSLITMFFYLKFYRKKRAKWFIIPTVVSVAATVIGILCATNQTTIIIFYAVYAILNVILMSISDSRRSGVIRVLSLHSHILESNAFSTSIMTAGRTISSLLIVLSGVLDSIYGGTLFLKIVLGIVCVNYIMFGVTMVILENALIKQDAKFKQEHSAEAIEKTED